MYFGGEPLSYVNTSVQFSCSSFSANAKRHAYFAKVKEVEHEREGLLATLKRLRSERIGEKLQQTYTERKKDLLKAQVTTLKNELQSLAEQKVGRTTVYKHYF